MNREVLFNIWDSATGTLFRYDDNRVKLSLNGSVAILESWATKDCVKLQYSGMDDRDGDKLFDGDIVNIYHSKIDGSTYAGQLSIEDAEIVFHVGCFCYKAPAMSSKGFISIPLYMVGIENIKRKYCKYELKKGE